MKRIVLASCMLLALFALDIAAETRTLNVANFDEVAVGSGMHVVIKPGSSFQVTASGASDDLQRLEVRQSGNRLEFSIRRGVLSFSGTGRIDLDISLPVLHRLNLSGGSEGRMTVQTGVQPFSAGLSGGS